MSTSRLIDALKQTLEQEHELLALLDDSQYTQPGTAYYKSSVGMHIRHNLDHFAAFFSGLKAGRIDYESRQRNELIQESAAFAKSVIADYLKQLAAFKTDADTPCLVREEDGTSPDSCQWLQSSCGRELQFLLGHTVHHHALIAMMLHQAELPLPKGFGVAPSTQRHEAKASS